MDWILPARRVEIRWDFVPDLASYAITARQKADDAPSSIEAPLGAYFEEVVGGERTRRRLDRLILPPNRDEAEHRRALTTFLTYVLSPVTTPSTNAGRLDAVAGALAEVRGVIRKGIQVNGYRVAAHFETLSERRQALTAYVYDEMVLLSSRVCKLDDVLLGQFASRARSRADELRRLDAWVLKQNATYRRVSTGR